MSIAAMAVWIITVIIGVNLLASGITSEHQRSADPPAGKAEPAAGHPLLEFSHPALGLIGLMFWIFFVVTHHVVFAWTAFGTMAVTALAGISWLASGTQHRRRARVPAGPVFPRRLALLHGLAVTCTFILVLIAAISHR